MRLYYSVTPMILNSVLSYCACCPLHLKEEPSQNQKIKDVTSDAIFHTYCKVYAYNVIVELSLVGYNL